MLEKLNTHHFFLSTNIIFWNFSQNDIGQNIQRVDQGKFVEDNL